MEAPDRQSSMRFLRSSTGPVSLQGFLDVSTIRSHQTGSVGRSRQTLPRARPRQLPARACATAGLRRNRRTAPRPPSRGRSSRLSASSSEGKRQTASRDPGRGDQEPAIGGLSHPQRFRVGSAPARGSLPKRQSETRSRTAADRRSHRIGMPSALTASPRTNPPPAVRIPTHRSETRLTGIRRMIRTPAGEQVREDRRRGLRLRRTCSARPERPKAWDPRRNSLTSVHSRRGLQCASVRELRPRAAKVKSGRIWHDA